MPRGGEDKVVDEGSANEIGPSYLVDATPDAGGSHSSREEAGA